jgi:4-carboxymuconolactone decarboxylase
MLASVTMHERPLRLPPLPQDDWSDQIPTMGMIGAGGAPLNIFGTLAHHPGLLKRWLVFAAHVLSKSSLTARDREVLILRTGWRTRAAYEWNQHVAIALDAGMTIDEIGAIATGSSNDDAADPLTTHDRLLMRAADELHDGATLSDTTWSALTASYRTEQMLDVVATVGQYHLVSFLLNATGVQLDAAIPDRTDLWPAAP